MSFNRRTFFSALIGAGVGTAVLAPQPVQASIADPTVQVFGAIRFLSVPTILNDAGHTPHGLTSCAINANGTLRINHTNLVEVGWSSIACDETLTLEGLTAGVSQGFTNANVYLYSSKLGRVLDLSDPDDYAIVEGTNRNVWFYARSTD